MAIIYRRPQIYKEQTKIDSYTLINWKMNDASSPMLNYGTAGALSLITSGTPLYAQPGLFDKAISFTNNINQTFSTGNTSIGEPNGNTITVSCWVKLRNYTFYGIIFCKNYYASRNWAQPYSSLYLALSSSNDGAWQPGIAYSGSIHQPLINATESKIPLNKWTLLSLTYDGNYIKFHKNGVVVYTANLPGTISFNDHGSWDIGGTLCAGVGQPIDGLIEDIRVENTVRTDSYLLNMYNQSILNDKYKLGIYAPIIEYEPSAAGVEVYSSDNTKIDRLWNRTTDTSATKNSKSRYFFKNANLDKNRF